ncbi:hypothetical protein GCM10011490_18050 [Pseudoclavibacter endophyticus]|uniref:TadE/TadG family type IV pilus assembly protein n=1 Tax=Pseudoclavibacter endophyticus TaxID=1778590 RepID=UPI00166D878D|nr:TadE/TadG family type IV pilus assembly protein [Pseudoclavibacter endophyticus]GGA67848.1 hypothetical protein GCM10011490_18050 [Pseudoclavibacter endophyticus]
MTPELHDHPPERHPIITGGATCARDERGASSVEAALVLPVLLVLFFSIVQGATTLHAGNVAQAAAQAAFEEGRLLGGSAEDAIAAGLRSAAASGTALTGVTVDVAITETTITVTISGSAPSLVPGIPVHVERTVSGPRERWVG